MISSLGGLGKAYLPLASANEALAYAGFFWEHCKDVILHPY